MTLCGQGHKIHLFDFILRLSLNLTQRRERKNPNQNTNQTNCGVVEIKGNRVWRNWNPAALLSHLQLQTVGSTASSGKAHGQGPRKMGSEGFGRETGLGKLGVTVSHCYPDPPLGCSQGGVGGRSLRSSHWALVLFQTSTTPFEGCQI